MYIKKIVLLLLFIGKPPFINAWHNIANKMSKNLKPANLSLCIIQWLKVRVGTLTHKKITVDDTAQVVFMPVSPHLFADVTHPAPRDTLRYVTKAIIGPTKTKPVMHSTSRHVSLRAGWLVRLLIPLILTKTEGRMKFVCGPCIRRDDSWKLSANGKISTVEQTYYPSYVVSSWIKHCQTRR